MTNESLRIRPMTLSDIEEVAALEAATSSTPWSSAMFVHEVEHPDNGWYVVAELEGRFVGFAGCTQLVDEAHVTTIAVTESARRRGVASALLRGLLVEALSRGVIEATLEVRASNDAAISLYRRFGFAPEGVRPGYYQHPTEDALILWLRGSERMNRALSDHDGARREADHAR